MSSESDQSHSRTRLPRLTALHSSELSENHRRWQLEFAVRGELVCGTLHAVKPLVPESELVVWVHTGSEMPCSVSEPPAGTVLLELHWPLLGPRQSAKLSPLITSCLTGADVSPNQEILWRQFTQQAVSEIEQALEAVRNLRDVQVGELMEIRLEIDSAPNSIQRRHWRPPGKQAPDAGDVMQDFLDGLRLNKL